MGYGIMFCRSDFDEKPERRLAGRPPRGNRAKVKAARKARLRNSR